MTVPDAPIHDGGFASGPVRAEGKHSHCILTINGGSSSLKFAVFVAANSIERLLSGRVERIGRGNPGWSSATPAALGGRIARSKLRTRPRPPPW